MRHGRTRPVGGKRQCSPFSLDWDVLQIFYWVAKAHFLQDAERILRMSASSISRQIAYLENSLKSVLFERCGRRGLRLTQAGRMLFSVVEELAHHVTLTETLVREQKDCVRGELTIFAPRTFGIYWLQPFLYEFQTLYPDITFRLFCEDKWGGMEKESGLSFYLSTTPPKNKPHLYCTYLCSYYSFLYGAPSYLEKKAEIRKWGDLEGHHLVSILGEDNGKEWAWDQASPHLTEALLKSLSWCIPSFITDDVGAMSDAIVSGLGLGFLPSFVAEQTHLKRIESLSQDIASLPKTSMYLSYRQEYGHFSRIQALENFLREKSACDNRVNVDL